MQPKVSIRFLIIISLCFVFQTLLSNNSPFLTYTISGRNEWKITQDAYVVSEVLFKDLDLYYPEDIFIKDGKMYIADSGNARIVVYDMKTRKVSLIGEFSLGNLQVSLLMKIMYTLQIQELLK